MDTRVSTIGCTRAGNRHENEDGWGSAGSLAWVLDGATGTSAAGLVRRVSAALTAHAGDEAPLADVVAAALAEAVRPDGASATLAVTRRCGDQVEWLLLGDASIILTDGSGRPEVLTDDRLASVGVMERAAWCNAVRAGADRTDVAAAWERLRAAENAGRNKPGGFWVVGENVDVSAARTGIATTAEPVLLLTDGVLDGIGSAWTTTADLYTAALATHPFMVLTDLDAGLAGSGPLWIDDATLAKQRLIPTQA